MDNKKLWLAILLSVGFLFIWSTFVIPRFAPPQTPAATVPPLAAPAAPAVTPAITSAHQTTTGDVWDAKKNPEVILRNPENEIVFSPRGAAVHHWYFKGKGEEADLVHSPAFDPLPLTTFPDKVFSVNQRENTVVMDTVLPNGLRFRKTLMLNPSGHLHDLTFQFENPTAQPVEIKDWGWNWGPGLGTVASEQKENSGLIRVLTKTKSKAEALKPGTHAFGEWAAIDNRYYLIAFIPVADGGSRPTLHVDGKKEHTTLKIQQPVSVPARGQTVLKYQLYAGPKGYTQLRHYEKGLEAAVDFGWFSSLGKLVLKTLYWLQEKTGNYGWAIVILTILLQVLLSPLTIKSYKAMMVMKELQPQIAALQKNYKNDPKRLNVEMMNLYKKKGTNPLGGCLPMLLQLPIFWALFTTLRNAYELRGAEWIGWIRDLSAADPYHVLPIVMGAGMFLQQRLSGAVTDPMQRQLMYIMPIMFTVMFWNFSSGLVLYWFVQSLISMGIQFTMLRLHKKSAPALSVIGK
jgi:YidC/Oxa1 family membrane protein insertase